MVENLQTLRRRQIINRIVNTLVEAKEKDLEINEDAFLLEIISNTGVARRTAREYLSEAYLRVNSSAPVAWENSKLNGKW